MSEISKLNTVEGNQKVTTHRFRATSGTDPDCWRCGKAENAEIHNVLTTVEGEQKQQGDAESDPSLSTDRASKYIALKADRIEEIQERLADIKVSLVAKTPDEDVRVGYHSENGEWFTVAKFSTFEGDEAKYAVFMAWAQRDIKFLLGELNVVTDFWQDAEREIKELVSAKAASGGLPKDVQAVVAEIRERQHNRKTGKWDSHGRSMIRDIDTLLALVEQLSTSDGFKNPDRGISSRDDPESESVGGLPAWQPIQRRAAQIYETTLKLAIEIVEQSINGDDAISKLEGLLTAPPITQGKEQEKS